MKSLTYNLYLNLSDGDCLSTEDFEELTFNAESSTIEKAKAKIKKNAKKIRAIKIGKVDVSSVSIVEVLDKGGDIETEEVEVYPVDKLDEIEIKS